MYKAGLLSLLLLSFVFCGCAPKNTNPVLTGTVTFDSPPLPEGSISFEAGDGGAYEVAITEGKYTVQLPAGKMRVRIRSNKLVGTKKSEESDSDPVYEQIIPEQYNQNTTLECEVPAKGGTSDFTLTSDK